MDRQFDLDKVIRKVPDFPKKGILYYDITSILADPEAFSYCIESLADLAGDGPYDAVACIEARGFIFGAPLALRLALPLILVRKMGKLPNKVHTKSFDLEYGSDVVCIQQLDITAGQRILLIDDLVATGGTLKAATSMFEEHGARVEKILGIIGLPFLDYQTNLAGYNIQVLQEYHGE